mgnify:CR=1 FL=1
MNKVKFSLFALVAIFAASCVADPVMEGEGVAAEKSPMAKIINSSEGAAAGELILYVDEETADAWTVSTTRSGNAQLDAVAEELGVESIAPVFNMNINGDAKREQGMHRWFIVEFDEKADMEQVAQKFAAVSSVKRVQYCSIIERPDVKAVPLSPEEVAQTRSGEEFFNDEMLALQWHYNNKGQQSIFPGAKEGEDIGAYGAWNYTTGSREVVVAVVDEGVKYNHPDLAANMWVNQAEANGVEGVDDDKNGYVDDIYGLNAVKLNGNISWDKPAWSDGEYVGDSGHGTHVAGTIAAVNNNGIGVCGVAGGDGSGNNGVRIMSIQIFDGGDRGDLNTNAKGIEYAADNGACILQNSWGYNSERGPKSDSAYSTGYYGIELTALRYFQSQSGCPQVMDGNVVIFAAGNEAHPSANYPSAYNEFISVTAYAPDGLPTSYDWEEHLKDLKKKGWFKVALKYALAIGIDSDEAIITFGDAGSASATGGAEAQDLANVIKSGALPFDLEEIELRSVGPTLGERALETSLFAGFIGLLLVMIFMIIIYRLSGVVASISLAFYTSLMMIVMAILNVNLSLPGIAGIILSIGMAVDANVVIYERIKEELRLGKTLKASIDAGFKRAFTAILDSNITTLIASIVLYLFGMGTIKGFAVTLGLGVVISMFTVLVVSRFLLYRLVDMKIKSPKAYGA